MGKLSNQTPDISRREMKIDRRSIRSNPQELIESGKESLKNLKLTEKEKIESGEYEWVMIQPKIGKPYKALKKKVS